MRRIKNFVKNSLDEAKHIKKVTVVQYIREKEQYGIWDKAKKYCSLLDQAGIKVPFFSGNRNDENQKVTCPVFDKYKKDACHCYSIL